MDNQVTLQRPRLAAVGTANPASKYSQSDVLECFNITDRRTRKIFSNAHIQARHLCLPAPDSHGNMPDETPADLLQKHQEMALHIGREAIDNALRHTDLAAKDIDYLAVISTTGFLCPGLSAHVIKAMGMRPDIHRIDIVGMGCNAGLNGMQPVVNYCTVNPDSVGLMLCVEICSAMYVVDDSINSAVVNSLFGDGAAATIISAKTLKKALTGPRILDFSSHIIPDAREAMRTELQGNKFAFCLDKQVPYVLGLNVRIPVDNLLNKHGLKRRDISHWVIHSGGRKVIDSIKYSLNISEHDVRHTTYILQHYGNVSSGSFLFSYERLVREGTAQTGDLIVMMTMGPGSTIECCLGEF